MYLAPKTLQSREQRYAGPLWRHRFPLSHIPPGLYIIPRSIYSSRIARWDSKVLCSSPPVVEPLPYHWGRLRSSLFLWLLSSSSAITPQLPYHRVPIHEEAETTKADCESSNNIATTVESCTWPSIC
ncbi:hypothetical protein P152DRAFT_57921 [Eremomyces bilateralis CBS 781.70]|uniref:Uncharacterized protein n=1 Tax=Eremomyces bilateralis CBS 781.70 TaxID=1392243 RepID=A0A6G1G0N6_9PEZI|nr:uncharacterized protein P152DRAFT_57921 [Eremomyces bilateralis CBS 781.70]KAF1811491.1 hypothetical protein P152DRAFT_57921 [Eremomyces bilateralis CBS 781.70]